MSEPVPPSSPDAPASKRSLYLTITRSLPLLITVIVHVIILLIAGVFIVQEQIIGKKKVLQAAPPPDSSAQKQVEHRLQIARRGGASGASGSPIEVDRIFSTNSDALQMPALPDLPSVGGPGGFGGFGGNGAGVGLGAGAGMATSLGAGAGLGGRGFMSMSFLGITDQNVQNVVFIIDASARMMDLRKSGFRAFEIIRDQIGSLIGRLPPAAKFNVILYGNSWNAHSDVNPFRTELVAATTENKEAFFAWMKPVNLNYEKIGPASAATFTPWKPKPLPDGYGFDRTIGRMNRLASLIQAGIEQQPDTIFIITGDVDGRAGWRAPPSAELIRRHRAQWDERGDDRRKGMIEYEKAVAELARRGVTPESMERARSAASKKAVADLAEANRKLVAAGKQPVVNIGGLRDIQARQSELKKAGVNISIDGRGWLVDNEGKPINLPNKPDITYKAPNKEDFGWSEVHLHINRLQRAFTPKKVAVTTMLFVGPDDSEEKVEQWSEPLREISKRNDGKFQVITTKRLEEIIKAQNAAPGGKS